MMLRNRQNGRWQTRAALPKHADAASDKATAMADERHHYTAYLLRLWQTRDDGHLVWRASLTDPHTGERRSFGSVPQLIAFLQDQTEAQADRREDEEGPCG